MNQQCVLVIFLHLVYFDLLDNSINFVVPVRDELTEFSSLELSIC